MGFSVDTELMQNQKHAVVMAPDKSFDVLQTPDGHSLFISIGDDHRLWVCREMPKTKTETPKTKTGWLKTDLSASLWQKHRNPSVRYFTVSQSQDATKCDIMLALRVDGNDLVYMSLNIPNTQEAWQKGVVWNPVPFDAVDINGKRIPAPKPFEVAGLFMQHMPRQHVNVAPQNIFVDLIHDVKGDQFKRIDRYAISPTQSPHWSQHNLPIDLTAGTISSCLGTRQQDLLVPGIYTLGKLKNTPALVYTTQWNPEDRRVAPFSVTLERTPQDRTAIASAFNERGYTNLFVAAAKGLYLFAAGNQKTKSEPKLIVAASDLPDTKIFNGVSEMSAMLIRGRTFVWCLNGNGQLFYTSCPHSEEDNPLSWTLPVPIASKVEAYAFYINVTNTNNTLFAHVAGQKLYKFTQNSITTAWTRTEILLPPTKVSDIRSYNSFTTQIKYSDDDAPGLSDKETELKVQAVSHVTVYVNDVYHVLDPNEPLQVTTRHRGCLDIVQPTSSLSAVCYYIWLAKSDGATKILVNPLNNSYNKLKGVHKASNLDVEIRNEYGVPRPLVPDNADPGEKQETAETIGKLYNIHKDVPADGSLTHHSQPLHAHGQANGDSRRLSFPGLKVLAGDFFHWLDEAAHLVDRYEPKLIGKIWGFVVHIGKKEFHSILDCASAVAGAIQFVLNKIKVGIEDLIAWLGFLFEWPDILRTHRALKNVVSAYLKHLTKDIGSLEKKVQSSFKELEKHWGSWKGHSGPSSTIGTTKQKASDVKKAHSPQASWGVNHFSNNHSSAHTAYKPPEVKSSSTNSVFKDLKEIADEQLKIAERTADEINTEIVEKVNTLTPMSLATKITDIFGEAVLSSGENLVVKLLDIIKLMSHNIDGMLEETLHIPIISTMYEKFAAEPLSILDLACLIAAIPVTIVCKAITDKVPFPEGSPLLGFKMTFEQVAAVLYPKRGPHKDKTRHNHKSLAEAFRSDSWIDILQASFNILAFPCSIVWALLSNLKYALTSVGSPVPPKYGYMLIPTYVFLVGPNFPAIFALETGWINITNGLATGVCILKTAADNWPALSDWIEQQEDGPVWNNLISPAGDVLLNALWLAPALGQIIEHHDKPSGDLEFAANACFDVGGVIAPFGTLLLKAFPELAPWLFEAGNDLNIFYGALSLTSAPILLIGN